MGKKDYTLQSRPVHLGAMCPCVVNGQPAGKKLRSDRAKSQRFSGEMLPVKDIITPPGHVKGRTVWQKAHSAFISA